MIISVPSLTQDLMTRNASRGLAWQFSNNFASVTLQMGLLTKEICEFVNQAKLGFIATVCPDGTPNLSPKGTTIAWDEDHLAFADIYSPGTISNLLLNPSIEINVVDVFTRKGYRFKGIAEVLYEGTVFNSILSHYLKAGSQYRINSIVLVKVRQVIALVSPAYDNYSQDEITKRWIDYWNSIHSNAKA
jgi:predicted pyridoxine 5'-phosphate oxidase superfamily flavin-nucleotide-binding protein